MVLGWGLLVWDEIFDVWCIAFILIYCTSKVVVQAVLGWGIVCIGRACPMMRESSDISKVVAL